MLNVFTCKGVTNICNPQKRGDVFAAPVQRAYHVHFVMAAASLCLRVPTSLISLLVGLVCKPPQPAAPKSIGAYTGGRSASKSGVHGCVQHRVDRSSRLSRTLPSVCNVAIFVCWQKIKVGEHHFLELSAPLDECRG